MDRHIGDRIKQARNELKMTQDELAKKCGVKRAAVSQWESGKSKSPTAENVMLLAKALGKPSDWFITGKGSGAGVAPDAFMDEMKTLSATERQVVLTLIGGFRKLVNEAAAQLAGNVQWINPATDARTARQLMLDRGNMERNDAK